MNTSLLWMTGALLIGAALVPVGFSLSATSPTSGPLHVSMPQWARAGPSYGTTTSTSTNWAGFVVPSSNGAVTDVKGSWVQPRFHGSCGGLYNNSESSFWVGIDGWGSNTVEQAGTSVSCVSVLFIGVVTYFAWYEFYPAGPVTIAMSISPGDHMSAEVKYSAAFKSYTVSIKDSSTGKSFSTSTTGVTANRSSAEWIAEAPSSSSGIIPLVDFGTVRFTAASATISGTAHAIGGFSNVQVTMWNQAGTAQKAAPSSLSSSGAGFVVRWLSYGP
jgi:hypothetical protein